MSNKDDSAIDAMVDEVMAGRAAAEAAAAPPDFSEPAEEVPVAKTQESIPSIGFVEESADADAEAEDDSQGFAELRAERDSYLADSQRLAADFSNFRKQSEKRVADTAATQSAGLVRSLLPVLDACDSALDLDGESAISPIRSALIGELERNGLELLTPAADDVFDPEQHEAVMHEPAGADSGHDGPVISEVLRAGYLWKGRVVRPAMVKVIG
jgi:molecular chaperone GrpE